MTMKKFSEIYGRVYETLYKGEIPYDTAIDGFDEKMESDKNFLKTVQKFCQYRQDAISSDREAAAFFLAYGAILEEQRIKELDKLWARI